MKLYFLLLLTCISFAASAQDFALQSDIASDFERPRDVHSVDLDGDGDIDIISLENVGSDITWFENVGDGNFAAAQIIFSGVSGVIDFDSSDLDGDGDIDLISCSTNPNEISWFENDGNENFSEQIIISYDIILSQSVHAADLDNDGDIDVLATSAIERKVAWYENDGNGNFSSENIITTNAHEAGSVHAADLDNDGDLDVISASYADDKIAWYQNDGNGEFSNEMIISLDADGADMVYPADLNGDGYIDVLSASLLDNKVAWYENDGNGNFNSESIITLNAEGAKTVYAADLDSDGDLDVLASSVFDYNIALYENDGDGNFGAPILFGTNSSSPGFLHAADIDLDGDEDVLCSLFHENKIIWFENLLGEGCLDSEACNYDSEAFINNGTCCFVNCGCLDEIAVNYDPIATCSNQACQYIEGCSSLAASNYNPEVTLDDGSCHFTFSGIVYHDEDENGELDELEIGLPFQSVTIEPLGIVLITNDQGMFNLEVEGSQLLWFTLDGNPVFPFNTTDPTFHFDPDSASDSVIEFGISNEVADFGICIDLYPNGNGFLCNDWSNHNICYRNMGSVPIDGIVELEYDPLFQAHSEITPIDSTNGNIVYMSFQGLQPGQMFFDDVRLLTPTVEHIGEFVQSHARVTGFYEGQQVAFGEQALEMEITCAYDPNDKQAFPLGYTEAHWLLQETEQEFLVRFQNTGNAPAQNIRIQDTLDVSFDISTFKLMANSHSVMTSIDPETRLIDFYFEDIQLPDSVNNEPDSHGLIAYKITPLPNLPAETVLENTAYIYFDNNDPIITNTTWTTIHECGGESEFISSTALLCDQAHLHLESTYGFVETYSWQIDDQEFGMENEYTTALLGLNDYSISLTATNPLCEETTTQILEIPSLDLFDPCSADFTCDGNRNIEDLLALLSDFGCLGDCGKDLDNDHVVGSHDLLIFLTVFANECWN